MEGFSLEELTAQLQAVQKKTTTARLSERNIIELVNKLKELGFFGDDLLHTTNGQEYITTDRLREEIKEALVNSGGRLPMTDLPALLNVDLHYCECQVALIVEESKGSVVEFQGELIMTVYFDNVAAEINDLLQDSGMLKIGDLAIQYSLSSEMVLSIIRSRLGSVIDGHLEGGMVYTSMYIDRMQAQLRGALRGVTSPMSLAAIVKMIGLEETGISNLINGVVDGLLKKHAIQGQLRVGGQWVPAVYVKAQQVAVRSFYNQNGWIALESIRKLGNQSEDSFISENLPQATKLHSVVVSAGRIAQVDAEIKEVASTQQWCDVVDLLPSEFSSEDVSLALKICPSTNGGDGAEQLLILADNFVVSNSFVESCRDHAKEEGKSLATQALQKRQDMGKTAEAALDKPVQEKKSVNQVVEEDDGDDWGDTGKGKGKKKGKGKAKGKGRGATGQATGGSKGASASSEPSLGCYPTKEGMGVKIAEWFPDLDDGCDEGTLGHALLEIMLPAATGEYSETIKIATRTVSQSRRQVKEGAMKELEESAQRLWLYIRGADLLSSDESTYGIIMKALVRGTGAETVDWLLRLMQLQEPNSEIAEPMVPIPGPERNQIASMLPGDMTQEAVEAIESLKTEDPKTVLGAVEAGAESMAIRFKKTDKKLEKQKVTELRATLVDQLTVEQNPSVALTQALPLLFAKVHDRALSIPGRAMPGVIKFMAGPLSEGEHSVLEAMHKLVVESLKAKSAKEDDEEFVTQLQEYLPKLLAICGV